MPEAILMDIPEAFETERLLIRCPQPGDGAAVNQAIQESLSSLQAWMPWATPGPTPQETELVMRRGRVQFLERTNLMLLLFHTASGAVVGGSGLHRVNWDVPSFEIGYWCRTRFEGQGYISEAVRGITAFAFEALGANRVHIRMDSHNVRSQAVAERVGYRFEGQLRNEGLAVDGSLRDTLVYALIPSEYALLKETWKAHGQ